MSSAISPGLRNPRCCHKYARSPRRPLLDECGSEDEFRLRCAAANEDPEDVFRPYGQYVALASGMTEMGISRKFRLSDWWAFEKIPGAVKPDPRLTGLTDRLRRTSARGLAFQGENPVPLDA